MDAVLISKSSSGSATHTVVIKMRVCLTPQSFARLVLIIFERRLITLSMKYTGLKVRKATWVSGDPNGIRTRVTPVKGECPRPLDDRVNKLL